MIMKWLWLDRHPKTQAEIARTLGVSRSAVCQRRQKLIKLMRLIEPNTLFDQILTRKLLNNEIDDCYFDCVVSSPRLRSAAPRAMPLIIRTGIVDRKKAARWRPGSSSLCGGPRAAPLKIPAFKRP
jgi:hypothetical protein